MITNNGMLTITGGGNILGGNNSTGAGGIINNGTLTLLDGNIVSNKGLEGGAVVNSKNATFTLSGGGLYINASTKYGGGAVINHGTMVMTSGGISSNTAAMNGGGIWTDGTLHISDGVIEGNTAATNGGGICFFAGTLAVSGSPVILGNNSDTDNLYINTGAVVTCAGPLEELAQIHMTHAEAPTVEEPRLLMTGVTGETWGLAEDDPDQLVKVDDAGNAKLYLVARVNYDFNTGGMYSDRDRVPLGTSYTLRGRPGYIPEHMVFMGWRMGEDGEHLLQPGDQVTLTGDTDFTAVWISERALFQRQIDEAEDGATLMLEGDLIAIAGDSELTLPRDKTITIDLNGHTIDRGLGDTSVSRNDGQAFYVLISNLILKTAPSPAAMATMAAPHSSITVPWSWRT